jgi:WD40 repeat protein
LLKCGHNVCRKHFVDDVINAKKSKIMCQECSDVIEISDEDFIGNKMLNDKIKKADYLNPTRKRLKIQIEKSLDDLESLLEDLNLRVEDFSVTQYDYFAHLRRKIDIRRESLILEINKISEEMINSIKETEKTFLEKVNESICSKFDIKNEKEKLEAFFRNSSLTLDSIETLKIENDAKCKELKAKLNNFDLFEQNLNDNSFKSGSFNFNDKPFSFGNLRINVNPQAPVKFGLKQAVLYSLGSSFVQIMDLESENIGKNITQFDEIYSAVIYDSYKLVFGDEKGCINIFDLKQNKTIKVLVGHEWPVFNVYVLQNDRLASSCQDSIRIWDLKKEILIVSFDETSFSKCLEQLPNGNLLSACNNLIKIWDLKAKKSIQSIQSHESTVRCLKSLDNGSFASGYDDGMIKIFSISTCQCIRNLAGHTSMIRGLELTESSQLISCSNDGTVRVWDFNNNQFSIILYESEYVVSCMRLNTNGELLIKSGDGTIRFWDSSLKERKEVIEAPFYSRFELCSILKEDNHFKRRYVENDTIDTSESYKKRLRSASKEDFQTFLLFFTYYYVYFSKNAQDNFMIFNCFLMDKIKVAKNKNPSQIIKKSPNLTKLPLRYFWVSFL